MLEHSINAKFIWLQVCVYWSNMDWRRLQIVPHEDCIWRSMVRVWCRSAWWMPCVCNNLYYMCGVYGRSNHDPHDSILVCLASHNNLLNSKAKRKNKKLTHTFGYTFIVVHNLSFTVEANWLIWRTVEAENWKKANICQN